MSIGINNLKQLFDARAQEFAKKECDGFRYHYSEVKSVSGSEVITQPIEHGKLIEGLLWYFAGVADEAATHGLDVRKGIRISGNTGSGKTLLMRIFQAMQLKHKFMIRNVIGVVEDYGRTGESIVKYTSKAIIQQDGHSPILHHLLLDDIGKEPLGGHFQKKDRNIIGEIIDARYKMWTDHGLITHFTDNLLDDDIEKIYGDRISGRIFHMTNHIFLGADDNSVDFRRLSGQFELAIKTK